MTRSSLRRTFVVTRAVALLLGLTVWLSASISSAGPAEELPVRIKADFFRYNRRTRVLVATGNVLLTAGDVAIRAETIVANLETGEVTAEGNVRLEVAGQSVTSDSLLYNLNTRLAQLENARAEYTGPFVLGSVSLRAGRMEGIPNLFANVREGFATTCKGENPVVYLTAEEVNVFANEKIVGRHVGIWVGGKKVLTVPYFLIFLRERRETRLSPVVGYSEEEGWFVKTTYSYFLNEEHYGFLHADWMERLGEGLGIEHVYELGEGRGSLLLYRLTNRRTGGRDFYGILSHVQRLPQNVSARLYADYSSQTFRDRDAASNLFAAVDLSRSGPGTSTFLFTTASLSSLGPSLSLTSRLLHTQTLSPRVYAEVLADLSRTSTTLGTDDELVPRLTLRYYGQRYMTYLTTETRVDLDGSRFPFDQRFTVERLPELNVLLFPFRLWNTPLIGQLEGGLGRFREGTGPSAPSLDAWRFDVLGSVSGPIRVGERGTLGVRAFFRGSAYTTGDLRAFYGGRAEYTVSLGRGWEAKVGYTGQTVHGTSPFSFDRIVGAVSSADTQVTYRSPEILFRLSGSYDLQTRQPGSIIAQAAYIPRPGWTIGLAASYSPTLNRVERVEANMDLRLDEEWRFQYTGIYDGGTQILTHDRVSITRTFCDCLAVSLTYLGGRKELWLEAWLTAIPWGRGKVGIGGRGNLLFEQPLPFFPR
jgi:hypothetical protein